MYISTKTHVYCEKQKCGKCKLQRIALDSHPFDLLIACTEKVGKRLRRIER